MAAATETISAQGTRKTQVAILLVDDDANNLVALESILNSPEYRLDRALSSDEALLALMHGDYAAIVLDVQMPGLNGIDLARLIKQRKRTANIPIIFLTAHYLENEHAMLAYEVGAVDYLTKPVHSAVLRSKVAVFVDLFRKTRALAALNQSMEAEILERATAEERFRVVVEAAPSAMLVFTIEGSIVLVNSQAEQFFHTPRWELLEKSVFELLPAEVLGVFPSGGELQEGGDAATPHEVNVARGDGTSVPAEVSITPIRSTEGARMLASIVDITERKAAEEALRAVNAELEAKNLALERQAAERILRLRAEAAREEAEAANEAKDRFLAMLSHELRTPLSPVLHTVTLLEKDPGVSPELREHLETIRRNVQLEARLIDDLLDLARIRNGKLNLQFEATDAHQVLRRALEICRSSIEARQLTAEMELRAERHWLHADSARLQQILWNLITNAVKFTPPGGSIRIATTDVGEDHIQIEVTDTGVGIDPDKLDTIFNAFEQGAHHTSSGLGLGLAICKALADFHGGSIFASSEGPGRGTTFSVRFRASSEEPAPSDRESTPPSLKGADSMRLLVVEDHADTSATLCRLLRLNGYEVQSAASFHEALQTADSYEFDVLVTDVALPDGNGVELFQQLRRLERHSHISGIALSGFGMDEDIARSKKAGFYEHLIKPVDYGALEKTLVELSHRSATPAAAE